MDKVKAVNGGLAFDNLLIVVEVMEGSVAASSSLCHR